MTDIGATVLYFSSVSHGTEDPAVKKSQKPGLKSIETREDRIIPSSHRDNPSLIERGDNYAV